MALLRCRVCGSKDVTRRLHFRDFPCHIWPLASEEGRLFRDADVYVCRSCGHIQLQDFEPNFIENLYVHETFNLEDPRANQDRVSTIERRLGAASLLGKRTLDIGGGRNAFSTFLPEGEKWICDLDVSDELRRPGVRVVEGDFLEAGFPAGYFDFISMFHALEHFNDPAAAVGRMAELLAPGGQILVEVPNIRSVIATMPYYAVLHQHISMFSSDTLTCLFGRQGLALENRFREDGVLFAAFSHGSTAHSESVVFPDARLGQESVDALEQRLETMQTATSTIPFAEDRSRVGLYGAGGSSALFLAHFPHLKNRIGICFDQNVGKQGRFLPGTDIPIHSPDAIDRIPLEQLVFLSSGLRKAVGDERAIQTIDIEQMILTLSSPEHSQAGNGVRRETERG